MLRLVGRLLLACTNMLFELASVARVQSVMLDLHLVVRIQRCGVSVFSCPDKGHPLSGVVEMYCHQQQF